MCNDTDFLEIMEKRYSVRSYSDKPVDKQKLDRILRAAQIAPTAVNKQPQRIYVLQSEEALKKAAQVTRFTFGAPLSFSCARIPRWDTPWRTVSTSEPWMLQ